MYVLAVELEKAAIDFPEIAEQNPDYRHKKPLIVLTIGDAPPKIKYEQIMKPKSGAGYKRIIRNHAKNPLPEIHNLFNNEPLSSEEALEQIFLKAVDLRKQGYGVYIPKMFLSPAKVYVILLNDEVLTERRFTDANPNYKKGQPCVYVGMTTENPEIRFLNHKNGNKANKYAQEYGEKLLPDLYDSHNKKRMYRWEAAKLEKQLAEELRSEGYAVWQN
jgi:predicted GIY-YIG superfamily endonuclease